MPALLLTLPVRMRIGEGDEFDVGVLTMDLRDSDGAPVTEATPAAVRAAIARLLREGADRVESGVAGFEESAPDTPGGEG